MQGKSSAHQSNDGRNSKTRARYIQGQLSNHIHKAPFQSHFFLRLAQRGVSGAGIACVHAPAGQRHLTGMRRKLLRALGQQHAQPLRARQQRQQHGSGSGWLRMGQRQAWFAARLGLPGRRRSKTLAQRR